MAVGVCGGWAGGTWISGDPRFLLYCRVGPKTAVGRVEAMLGGGSYAGPYKSLGRMWRAGGRLCAGGYSCGRLQEWTARPQQLAAQLRNGGSWRCGRLSSAVPR